MSRLKKTLKTPSDSILQTSSAEFFGSTRCPHYRREDYARSGLVTLWLLCSHRSGKAAKRREGKKRMRTASPKCTKPLKIRDKIAQCVLERLQDGADGGGRTHTSSRTPDFESGASANSATSAQRQANIKTAWVEVNEIIRFPAPSAFQISARPQSLDAPCSDCELRQWSEWHPVKRSIGVVDTSTSFT